MADFAQPGALLGMGLLQGVTEFLPVSSSGHLAAFALFLEFPQLSLPMIVLLHAATLLATVMALRGELWDLSSAMGRGLASPSTFLTTPQGTTIRNVVLATLVTAPVGLLLKSSAETATGSVWLIGLCFVVTAAALLSTRKREGAAQTLPASAALLIGLVQGIAVLPGLSRSGLTIACALALGMGGPAAFRFSFLLSLPAVAGAAILTLGAPGALASLPSGAWLAALAALASGYVCLSALRSIVSGGHFWLFAWYLIPLGGSMLCLDLLGNR